MKKQLLAIAIVTMLLVATLISTVSASTVTADKAGKEIKAGETVTVTVETNSKLDSAKIRLTYNSDKFSITSKDVKGNGEAILTPTVKTGEVVVTVLDSSEELTTNKVTFTFTAKEDVKAGEEKFELTEFSASKTESLDKFENKSVTVKVANTTTPSTSTKPSDSTKPSTSTKPSGSTSGKLPQLGAPLYVVGIAAVIVAAFVLMVKKAK